MGEGLLGAVSPFELDVSSKGSQLLLLVLAVLVIELYFVTGPLLDGVWWSTTKYVIHNVVAPLRFVEGFKVAAIRVNC